MTGFDAVHERWMRSLLFPEYDGLELLEHDGKPYGWRVAEFADVGLEIWPMAFNLRVVVTDRGYGFADEGSRVWDLTGHGWCYPRMVGVEGVAAWLRRWDDFTPGDPAATYPPGPWIKTVHHYTDVARQRVNHYRVPHIGQTGPDGRFIAQWSEASIRCPKCGVVSHHVADVRNLYCGTNCHEFHETMRPPEGSSR